MIQMSRAAVPLFAVTMLLAACGPMAPGNMGGPTPEARAAEIACEPRGGYFYGRRYCVKYTRFWGYLREPGQSAKHAKLVIFNESRKTAPDRLPEDGPQGQRYTFDQNHEYRIWGHFTGRTVYESFSNQMLPEFQLLDYKLVNPKPGWLFGPGDRYDPNQVTLTPR